MDYNIPVRRRHSCKSTRDNNTINCLLYFQLWTVLLRVLYSFFAIQSSIWCRCRLLGLSFLILRPLYATWVLMPIACLIFAKVLIQKYTPGFRHQRHTEGLLSSKHPAVQSVCWMILTWFSSVVRGITAANLARGGRSGRSSHLAGPADKKDTRYARLSETVWYTQTWAFNWRNSATCMKTYKYVVEISNFTIPP